MLLDFRLLRLWAAPLGFIQRSPKKDFMFKLKMSSQNPEKCARFAYSSSHRKAQAMNEQHSFSHMNNIPPRFIPSTVVSCSPSFIGPPFPLALGAASSNVSVTSASQPQSSGNIPSTLDCRLPIERHTIDNSRRQSVLPTAHMSTNVNHNDTRQIRFAHIYLVLVSGPDSGPLVSHEHIADTWAYLSLVTEHRGTFSVNAVSAMLLPADGRFPESLRMAREDPTTVLATAQSLPAISERVGSLYGFRTLGNMNPHDANINAEVLHSIPRNETDRCTFLLILANSSIASRTYSHHDVVNSGTDVQYYANAERDDVPRNPSQRSSSQYASQISETSYPPFTFEQSENAYLPSLPSTVSTLSVSYPSWSSLQSYASQGEDCSNAISPVSRTSSRSRFMLPTSSTPSPAPSMTPMVSSPAPLRAPAPSRVSAPRSRAPAPRLRVPPARPRVIPARPRVPASSTSSSMLPSAMLPSVQVPLPPTLLPIPSTLPSAGMPTLPLTHPSTVSQPVRAARDLDDACDLYTVPKPKGSTGKKGRGRSIAFLYQDWYHTRLLLHSMGFKELSVDGTFKEQIYTWENGSSSSFEDILVALKWKVGDYTTKTKRFLWASNAVKTKKWDPYKIPETTGREVDTLVTPYRTWLRLQYFFLGADHKLQYEGEIDPNSKNDQMRDLSNLRQEHIRLLRIYLNTHHDLIDINS
ncbi:hypothetical protein EV360DRAFT_85740 [Lentinula raphanica]|nr:hypothetical protein EV360DRAFT_85740 [Lentinula raphanica]